MPETQWMTLQETADVMNESPEQITIMCEDGKLEYYLEDGRYFVSRESIDLLMHPRPDAPEPSVRDANGIMRRKYGRAPEDNAPSSDVVADSETASGMDEDDDAGMEEDDDAGMEENGRIEEEVHGTTDEGAESREYPETPVTADETVDLELPDQAAAMPNPDDPNPKSVEIIADLRAAIARHAVEHKAFCDELASLADALESTLSRNEDKTSELTREISSLLARYIQR